MTALPLPAPVREVVEEWQLRVDGAATQGPEAVVVPVRTAAGRPAVLKVGPLREETEHAHLVLRQWNGRGAVQLLRADPRRGALLLERLHQERLEDLWDLEACEVVAGLYGRLHVPAIPQLHLLTSYADRWAADLVALPRNAPVPRRLVEQAISLARDFAHDPASTGTTIHGDLHYGTVLAGDREPWLAIDPRPMSGDPHYEPAPMLLHRFEELVSSPAGLSLREGIRSRFHALVDHAELDEHRARDWVVVRMVDQARRRLLEAPGAGSTTEHLTRCIAIAKAVQD